MSDAPTQPSSDLGFVPPPVKPMTDQPKAPAKQKPRKRARRFGFGFGWNRKDAPQVLPQLSLSTAAPVAPGAPVWSPPSSHARPGAWIWRRSAKKKNPPPAHAQDTPPETRTAEAKVITPTHVAIGWIDSPNQGDAIEAAKHFAEVNFDAPSLSSFYTMKLNDGCFWEVQQGGPGRAYLPNIVAALHSGKNAVWFRVRNRAYTISWRDQAPYCLLQPTEQSQNFFADAAHEIVASSAKLHPIVWRGGALLVIGIISCLTGMTAFYTATHFAAQQQILLPAPPYRDPASLPYAQLQSVENIPLDRYVEAQRFEHGHWQPPILRTVEKYRQIPIERLDVDIPTSIPNPADAPPAKKRTNRQLRWPLRAALAPHNGWTHRQTPAEAIQNEGNP